MLLFVLTFLLFAFAASAQDDLDGVEDFPIVYVVMGPEAVAIARAVVSSTSSCPVLTAQSANLSDERTLAVEVRSSGGTTWPYDFPVKVCEAELPRGSDELFRFGGKALPRVPSNPSKIVLVGDTGLRVATSNDGSCLRYGSKELFGTKECIEQGPFNRSAVSGMFQQISNWPLAGLTARAADEHPELVIHVGDYLYRQNPCPDISTCGPIGDEWGDTWRGWYFDFFKHSLKLLAAAPWIVLRGNHETCGRGGHGFFLFLYPRALPADWTPKDCMEYTDSYTVPFLNEQFLVLDDSAINPLSGGIDHMDYDHHCPEFQLHARATSRYEDPKQRRVDIDRQISYYRQEFQRLELASQSHHANFLLTHRPVFGVACNGTHYVKMDWTLEEALLPETIDLNFSNRPPLSPQSLDRISAVISGHMHWFQGLVFENDALPAQIVVGNGGTKLIKDDTYHEGLKSLTVFGFSVEHGRSSSHFGYSILNRRRDDYVLRVFWVPVMPEGQSPWKFPADPHWNLVIPYGLRHAHSKLAYAIPYMYLLERPYLHAATVGMILSALLGMLYLPRLFFRMLAADRLEDEMSYARL